MGLHDRIKGGNGSGPGEGNGEAPPVQPLSQFRGLGGHETPVAELGTGVSACGDLVEHLFITRTGALRLELQHAPRAGRIGDSDQVGLLISCQLSTRHVARDSHKYVRSAARARRYSVLAVRTASIVETSATGKSHHD